MLSFTKEKTATTPLPFPLPELSSMQPTYSFQEIKSLIRSLDLSSINILLELVEEEKNCFTDSELKAIAKFLKIKNRDLVRNEVQLEYLLSFN